MIVPFDPNLVTVTKSYSDSDNLLTVSIQSSQPEERSPLFNLKKIKLKNI